MTRSWICAGLALLLSGLVPSPGHTYASPARPRYVGTTPCGAEVREFLALDAARCHAIRWDLVLATRARSAASARYDGSIETAGSPPSAAAPRWRRYPIPPGTWSLSTIARGQPLLRLSRGTRALHLVMVSPEVLLFVDAAQTPLIGDDAASYSLSAALGIERRRHGRLRRDMSYPPPPPVTDSMAQVFVGRTPCHAMAAQLAVAVSRACQKLKWHLVLHPSAETRAGRFALSGNLWPEAPMHGTWRRDLTAGEETLRLYREGAPWLTGAFASDAVLLFLDGHGRPLAGNQDFAYVLNRLPSSAAASSPR